MILTRDEISFLDTYCHEGSELPFGGPATDAMTSIGVFSGDTLELQWASLHDQPPTGPVIGHASLTFALALHAFARTLSSARLAQRPCSFPRRWLNGRLFAIWVTSTENL